MLNPAPSLPPEPEPFLFHSQGLRFCLLPVVVLALVCGSLVFILRQQWSTVVPEVSGARLEEALRQLRTAQLIPIASDPERLAHADQQVAHSVPQAGTRVWRNSPVALTLSSGAEAFRVPDLLGRSRAEAMYLLQGSEFSLGFERALYSELPPGIIGQSPRPGELARGGLIDILLSLGPEPPIFVTPRLVGEQQAAVLEVYGTQLQRIEQIQIRPAVRSEQPGEIVEQDPAPGDPLTHDGLRLVIASGVGAPTFRILKYEVPLAKKPFEVSIVSAGIEVFKAKLEPGTRLRLPIPVPDDPTSVHILLDGLMYEEQMLSAEIAKNRS